MRHPVEEKERERQATVEYGQRTKRQICLEINEFICLTHDLVAHETSNRLLKSRITQNSVAQPLGAAAHSHSFRVKFY